LETNAPGYPWLQVLVDGTVVNLPANIENIIRFQHTLTAPDSVCVDGVEHRFVQWDAPLHAVLAVPPNLLSAHTQIAVLDMPSTMTAVFVPAGVCNTVVVRINAGGSTFVDGDGNTWVGDVGNDWEGTLEHAPGGGPVEPSNYIEHTPMLSAAQQQYAEAFQVERYIKFKNGNIEYRILMVSAHVLTLSSVSHTHA
jgi:hypothetical protein